MTTEDEFSRKNDFSCTFCGPGTWAVWEIVTDDGAIFACDRHHVEMSEAKMIRFERMMGEKTWRDFTDENYHERRRE